MRACGTCELYACQPLAPIPSSLGQATRFGDHVVHRLGAIPRLTQSVSRSPAAAKAAGWLLRRPACSKAWSAPCQTCHCCATSHGRSRSGRGCSPGWSPGLSGAGMCACLQVGGAALAAMGEVRSPPWCVPDSRRIAAALPVGALCRADGDRRRVARHGAGGDTPPRWAAARTRRGIAAFGGRAQ
jgi:hypothetical protein